MKVYLFIYNLKLKPFWCWHGRHSCFCTCVPHLLGCYTICVLSIKSWVLTHHRLSLSPSQRNKKIGPKESCIIKIEYRKEPCPFHKLRIEAKLSHSFLKVTDPTTTFHSFETMDKMNQALEKMKMLVGMEVDDEHQASALEEENSSSFAFMDDFNRNCTLSTKQVPIFTLLKPKSYHEKNMPNYVKNASKLFLLIYLC